MRRRALIGLAIGLAAVSGWGAAAADESRPADLAAIGRAVDQGELRDTITRLVDFGTRHTLSDTGSPTRGIGAARRWVRDRFAAIGAGCHGCLMIDTPEQTFSGERTPTPVAVQDVLAIQQGTSDPQRVVIISAHLDSRVSDVMDAQHDAPGADDDGSGVAAVLEAARVLSTHRFAGTIVYAVLSGEEQGLYGGRILADFARARGWRVEGVLNNDIVGNTHGQDGRVVADEVRVFSEGVRAAETPAGAAARRRSGGETDSASRSLARYMRGLAGAYMAPFRVRMIARADRFGRGGDQLPMQEAGYPAVRVTEADENYARQHQDVRIEGGIAYGDVPAGVDFPYLARVTRLDVMTLAFLASGPAPPETVRLEGAVTADTTVSWSPSPGAARYRVWWRDTMDPYWSAAQSRETAASSLTLKGINIDDFSFGVSAVSSGGVESPVEFAGSAGAFFGRP